MNSHYIDSHCHLDFTRLGNVKDIIEMAKAVGVNQFIVPSVNHSNWLKVLELANQYDEIFPALGVHPYFIEPQNNLTRLNTLAAAQRHNIVAIGEIGLDGAITTSLDQQLQVLIPQLKLASELDLPVICHAHKAYDPLLKQLRKIRLPRGGVIHAFGGSYVQAQEFIKLGFKLGLGGVITYPRANKLRTTVSRLSIDNILLETDSPDMPLHGQQGQPNTPANIPIIALAISELMGLELGDVALQTTFNSQKLFDISR